MKLDENGNILEEILVLPPWGKHIADRSKSNTQPFDRIELDPHASDGYIKRERILKTNKPESEVNE